MNVQTQFSRYAEHYGSYNVIQTQVVEKLIDDLGLEKPKRVLDLGCGNGTLYRHLPYQPEHFIGVDFAPKMLELHPQGKHIECLFGDFNEPQLFEQLKSLKFDRIFSASALQWADDIDSVFSAIASLNTPVSLAVFTSNTFKTLFETADLKPLLRDAKTISELAKKYFRPEIEVIDYKLQFESAREMFRYIKRSGVSGSRKILDYKATKSLMQNYPLDYLEFEVMFIKN